MGILDEAIREHLELKRQHGAGDSELQQLEDEAFGPPARPGSEPPDPVAEAPTEFMAQPEVPEDGAPDTGEEKAQRREVSITDLQEAPEQAAPAEEPEDLPPAEEPAEEEQPAMEHEVPDAAELGGHSTEERHAISEQPTELFDVEGELAEAGPPNPTDEDLIEEEISEPRLAPADPLAGLDEGDVEPTVEARGVDDDDEDDEFWNEQRLSDELDQALEAPRDPEPELEGEPELDEESEPAEEEPRHPEAEAGNRDDDVLEDTPDFLEDAPEDDQLWFEQKPPKDFDFDD
jgi:hypothetical protein